MATLTDNERITTRKLKGRARRAVTLSTKITPQELELISAASEADGRALGEWAREAILKSVRTPLRDSGTDQLMTEIIALQLFLTEALAPVACGERMTPAQYQELIQEVRDNKKRVAQEAIAEGTAEPEERHG